MAQLETEERGIDPEALCDLAERHEVSAVPLWSRSGSPVRFDVVFQPLARAQLNSASLWLTASVPPCSCRRPWMRRTA